MSQDISYWLAEVQSLQQQLAQTRHERDEAFAEAASWRDRFETETQLRQQQVQRLEHRLAQLTGEIRRLSGEDEALGDTEAIAAEVANLSPDELQAQLLQSLGECDRLRRDLNAERQAHQESRESLSIALGDAIDLLKQRS